MAKAKNQFSRGTKNKLKDKVTKKKNIKKSAATKLKNYVQEAVKPDLSLQYLKLLKPKQKPENSKRTVFPGKFSKSLRNPEKLRANQKIKQAVPADSNPVVLKEVKCDDNDEATETLGNFVKAPESPVDRNQIKGGVSALYGYVEKTATVKTKLFPDDEKPIFLQITAIKVPNTPDRQVRLNLQHALVSDESEICLFVKDVGKPKEHEETIEHFEELLSSKGVANIKTIMPFHQFKTEYGNQYELKRKLLGLYDHFLVDARIVGYVVHLLGKIFMEKRKIPTPVHMDSCDLKDHINKALKKTSMKIHSKGDSYLVQIGHMNMSQEEILDNVVAIVDELDSKFPGGVDNIRALGIKTEKSIAVPIYLTLKNNSTVRVPLMVPKLPEAFKPQTGELTTYQNRDITVLPSGQVIVHSKAGSDDEDLESGDELLMEPRENLMKESGDEVPGDDSTFVASDDEIKQDNEEMRGNPTEKENKTKGKKNKIKKEAEEDGIKDILAQAEEVYLNEYEKEQVSTRKGKNTKTIKNKSEKKEIPSKNIKKAIKVHGKDKQTGNKNKKQDANKLKQEVKQQKSTPSRNESDKTDNLEQNKTKIDKKNNKKNVKDIEEKNKKTLNLVLQGNHNSIQQKKIKKRNITDFSFELDASSDKYKQEQKTVKIKISKSKPLNKTPSSQQKTAPKSKQENSVETKKENSFILQKRKVVEAAINEASPSKIAKTKDKRIKKVALTTKVKNGQNMKSKKISKARKL